MRKKELQIIVASLILLNFFSLLNIINSRVNNCGVNKTICQQFKNISRLDMDDIKLKVLKNSKSLTWVFNVKNENCNICVNF